jgi:hypothetical protein
MLEHQVSNKWLDPAEFDSFEKFHKAYAEVYGKAKAFEEIINMLSGASGMAKKTKESIVGKKNYAI